MLEAFSPQNDQMLPFHLTLHTLNTKCIMYVEGRLLILHLNKNIIKYRAGHAGALEQVSRTSTHKHVLWQSSQPVVNAAVRAYYIVEGCKCYRIDMDTGLPGPAIQ